MNECFKVRGTYCQGPEDSKLAINISPAVRPADPRIFDLLM